MHETENQSPATQPDQATSVAQSIFDYADLAKSVDTSPENTRKNSKYIYDCDGKRVDLNEELHFNFLNKTF